MRKNDLALALSIIAAVLCFGAFVIKLVKTGQTNYPILFAGIFILAFGISTYQRKPN